MENSYKQSPGCELLHVLSGLFECGPPASLMVVTVLVGPEEDPNDNHRIEDMAVVTFHRNKQRRYNITNLRDSQGREVRFDGPVLWVSENASLVDVTVDDADGLQFRPRSFDALGAVTVTGTADRRHGPEVIPALIVLSCLVVDDDVATFEVEGGEEEDPTP